MVGALLLLAGDRAGAISLEVPDAPMAHESPPVPAPLAGPVDPQSYIVGPGDVFSLWVFGPIARQINLTVGPEGRVFSAELGPIPVSGRRLVDARERILARGREHFRGVGLELQLTNTRTFRVYLTGAVASGGPLLARGGSRLVDVVADSLLLPSASRRMILVRHADGSVERADLALFRDVGDPAHSVPLADGDMIHVPYTGELVGVFGAVGDPHRMELAPGDSLATLLRLAGGPLASAIDDAALLVRWAPDGRRDTLRVSLGEITGGQDGVVPRGGDQLYVFGRSDFQVIPNVLVEGQVRSTGSYPIRPGETRLSEVIAAAGGLLPDANRSAIRLVRRRPGLVDDPEFERLSRLPRESMTTSEYESFRTRLAALTPDFRVDWDQLQRQDGIADPRLQAGDIIRVDRISNALRVDGQVKRPGLITFEPGRSYDWYIRQAGGFANHAARSQVRVTRSASGQTLLAKNVDALAPGDFLWVPERPDISTWQQIAGLVAVAAQVATVVIAVRR